MVEPRSHMEVGLALYVIGTELFLSVPGGEQGREGQPWEGGRKGSIRWEECFTVFYFLLSLVIRCFQLWGLGPSYPRTGR